MTRFEESYVGRQVRYCGVSGVASSWSEERKKRVGLIEGYRNGYRQVKWRGEKTVKKFILVYRTSTGAEYQFRFPNPRSKTRHCW